MSDLLADALLADRLAHRHLIPDVTFREIGHYWGDRELRTVSIPDLPLNARWLDLRRGLLLLGSGPPMTDQERVLRRVRQEARRIVRDGMRRAGVTR